MIFKLIDGYSSETEIVLPNGQTFPAPSLVEGDQGHKYLISLSEEIPVKQFSDAYMADAIGIYRPYGGGRYATMTDFAEHGVPKPSGDAYELPEFIWSIYTPFDVLEAQEPTEDREEASTFVHLHTHSEFSALDGYSTMDEIVKRVKDLGQTAIAITDHGICSGHPYLQKACDEAGIKPIFGMEAYLVEDRFAREDTGDYQHLCLWAMDDEGLRNLWAISTVGYRDGFYGKPRVDYDTLAQYSSGVLASSACLRGPLSEPYLRGDISGALVNLTRLTDIFEDRFYIEIHVNQLPQQIKVNKWLAEKAREFEVPMIASVDSHYANEEQCDDHQVWLSMSTGKDVSDESTLFGGGQKYHLATEDEVMLNLAYLGEDVVVESMINTGKMADRCNARMRSRTEMPTFASGDNAYEEDAEALLTLCMSNWDERTKGKSYTQKEAIVRFEREFPLLVNKRYCGYFLQNADLVGYAKDNGVLVGPGRGSGAGSFVAYLCRITEVDPIENDLLFERFMTEGRTSLPDFDIDYPSSRKQFMIQYAESRWGKPHVVAVGTHTRIKNKGAFKDTARAIRSRLPEDSFADGERISQIIGAAEATTAGLGLSWDEMIDVCEEEFAPYKEKMPYLFEMAEKFRGRLKTYSRHAAGLVIDSKSNLEGTLPMLLSSDGITLVTQFDKDILEELGYVKFDFLNLRHLDTIQDTVDLIFEQTGTRIDVNKWNEEYKDPAVFEELCQGWTLGIFQLETGLGTRTIKQIQPRSVADISDAITIGRPGPLRSGLADMYFRRRDGKEEVSFPDKRMEGFLGKTYGCMLYQEDIMAACITLANYTGDEADHVRKILGKKKKELVEEEGKKFVSRAVENNTDKTVAQDLWRQMAEFALYSFNRAHAFSYATLSDWEAWLKHYYPGQFITSALSGIDAEEIPMFISEARRKGYKVLPPDINDSKEGFTNVGKVIRYGLQSIKGVGEAGTKAIIEGQPYADFDDFMKRKGNCDMGQVKILGHIGAFDSIFPNRKALEAIFKEEEVKGAERCINFNPTKIELTLPCDYNWENEPREIGKSGKPLKAKPLPKKCWTACRQYVQRPLPSTEEIIPYTDEQIRQIEMETLGIFLSSSPFDIFDPHEIERTATADDLQSLPDGTYISLVYFTGMRDHRQKDGKKMKFVTALTPSGSMDMSVFSSKLDTYDKFIRIGQLALVEVTKNKYGNSLKALEEL